MRSRSSLDFFNFSRIRSISTTARTCLSTMAAFMMSRQFLSTVVKRRPSSGIWAMMSGEPKIGSCGWETTLEYVYYSIPFYQVIFQSSYLYLLFRPKFASFTLFFSSFTHFPSFCYLNLFSLCFSLLHNFLLSFFRML